MLTIDRPGTRNAISRAVMDELSAVLDEIAASDTRVLGIRGAGDRVFVSGGDLKDLAAIRDYDEARDMALRMRGLLDKLAALPIPVGSAILTSHTRLAGRLNGCCHRGAWMGHSWVTRGRPGHWRRARAVALKPL